MNFLLEGSPGKHSYLSEMYYEYSTDLPFSYISVHLAILSLKVFWVKIIVANLYGSIQLTVTMKKRFYL
jgi:hypothetical protein